MSRDQTAAQAGQTEVHHHPQRLSDFFDHGVLDIDALLRAAPLVAEQARRSRTLYEMDAQQMMVGAFRGALDVLIAEIMGRAWLTIADLRDAARRSETQGLCAAPLHRHTIASDHTPQLEIFRGSDRIGSVSMAVRVEFAVDAMELLLDRGAIAGLKAGRYAGAGVAVVSGVKVAEVTAARFAIPGAYFLAAPIPIPFAGRE